MKLKNYLGILFVSTLSLLSTNSWSNGLFVVNACEPVCWSGFYIGAQAGESWNHVVWRYQNANYFNTLGPEVLGTTLDYDQNSFVGGVTFGANYQENAWVFGLEGNVLDGNFKKTRTSPFFATDRYTSDISWIGAAKIRFGYAYQRLLFSLTGGWAGGDLSLKVLDTVAGIRASSSEWSNGWTAGAGIDYMFRPNFSLGIGYDYLRLHLNNKVITCPSCGTGTGFGTPIVDGRVKSQTVMARVNYFFYQ